MPIRPAVKEGPFDHFRYRGGPIDQAVNEFGLLTPGRGPGMIAFEEDFLEIRVGAANVSGWIVDSSGSVTAALSQVTTGHGGVGLVVPGSTATNNAHYQWGTNSTVLSPFTMVAGKRLWMQTRFKTEDADKNLPIIGLHTSQTDPWNTEPADQFLFRSLTSDGVLQFVCGTTNSTEQTATMGTMADDTWYRAEAFYDGVGTALAWLWSDTGSLIAAAQVDCSSTNLPNGAMTVAFGMEMVDTGADDFSVDYLNVYMER